ncbi:MAG: hypothetical protein ABSG11_13220 [Candidatus Korobacteraceae bacterium]
MKKLNTYDIYRFARNVHPLTELQYVDGMKFSDIFLVLYNADFMLEQQVEHETLFSPSLKRSAGAVMRAMFNFGTPPDGMWGVSPDEPVKQYKLQQVVTAAKNFETVLSNEMPGLATYYVSTKGIYSTDDLISHADLQIPESLRPLIKGKAVEDIQQAGKCLAYEVSTASAFHMWRAVETVMCTYFKHLTGGSSFEAAGVQRNWAAYIKALNDKGADTRITIFLDHIRSEYRNPQNHPSETVDLEEAFTLFGVATSAITQMAKAMKPEAEALALAEASV